MRRLANAVATQARALADSIRPRPR
jgi:hypothetical protein